MTPRLYRFFHSLWRLLYTLACAGWTIIGLLTIFAVIAIIVVSYVTVLLEGGL